jgi:hypothetical protein
MYLSVAPEMRDMDVFGDMYTMIMEMLQYMSSGPDDLCVSDLASSSTMQAADIESNSKQV